MAIIILLMLLFTWGCAGSPHVDMTPVDAVVNRGLMAVGFKPVFKFDAQHVTVINGGTIMCRQHAPQSSHDSSRGRSVNDSLPAVPVAVSRPSLPAVARTLPLLSSRTDRSTRRG